MCSFRDTLSEGVTWKAEQELTLRPIQNFQKLKLGNHNRVAVNCVVERGAKGHLTVEKKKNKCNIA